MNYLLFECFQESKCALGTIVLRITFMIRVCLTRLLSYDGVPQLLLVLDSGSEVNARCDFASEGILMR